MKTDFSPKRYLGPDPFSLAVGATQTGLGALQSVLGFIQNAKARKQLENLQSPVYTPNQSIMDYYNKALARYNVSPTDSSLYKRQQGNIQRNTANTIYGLQQGRGVLGGVSTLVRNANDASLNAEVAAENQQNQRFNQLGAATGMKADEERTAFDVNKMQPFQRQFNLLAAKAGGGSNIANAGLSNVFGGLQNWSQMQMINKMYPTPPKK